MPEQEKIHVALAFNDPKGTYARHAVVTATSIFENTKSPVCVHVLHDFTLTDYNRSIFDELAERYGQEFEFHNVDDLFDQRRSDMKKLSNYLGKGTLFRLFLSDVVNVDKIIYLDCDIVVTLDIAELWNMPLNDKAVAVVRDRHSLREFMGGKRIGWRNRKIWKLWGVASDEYFNAGVLLMDLKKIRQEYNVLQSISLFLSLNKNFLKSADQDYLNWLFADDKTLIDEKFNRRREEGITEENKRGIIWHMMWKPWLVCSYPVIDDMYWDYLRLTPYCKSELDLRHFILNDLSASQYMHRHNSGCIKRLLRQLRDNLFRGRTFCVPRLLYALYKKQDKTYRGNIAQMASEKTE